MLGLIPGMEKADDYLLQAIVETVVLVIFLASHIYLGCGISLRKCSRMDKKLIHRRFFIVYCLYAVVSGIYLCFWVSMVM